MNFDAVKNLYINDLDNLEDVSTKSKVGIYIIYVPGIDENDLIPLYIGQSVNMYSRKNRHKSEIKKLFILEKEIFNKSIELNAGKYFYCKMASLLRNNNKSLEDVRFKVLEYCDKELLDEKENYYIEQYGTTVWGFNQFEEIIESNKYFAEYIHKKTEEFNYASYLIKGIEIADKFFSKLSNINNDYLKYKYYKMNINLCFGNYSQLMDVMMIVDKEKGNLELQEKIPFVSDEIDIKISRGLENTHFNINTIKMIMLKNNDFITKNEFLESLYIK